MWQLENIETERLSEASAHQLYDKAAKRVFTIEAVLGLLVKRSVIAPAELGNARADFLENEFSAIFIDESGKIAASRLVSDRIVRIRREGKPTVFLVLEIQSHPDGNMIIRMRRYVTALHDRLLETGLTAEDKAVSFLGMVVNIGLDRWTSPVSLACFHERKGRQFVPTSMFPDFSYMTESAEMETGTAEGRDAYSKLPVKYRELGIYHGMIKRCIEAKNIVPGEEELSFHWWLMFCQMTGQDMGVNMNLMGAEKDRRYTMEEILCNYRASLLNEGLAKGRLEGSEERLVRCICDLSRHDRISIAEAMDKLSVPEAEQEAYASKANALLESRCL